MLRTMLKSKIHRATVTECNINYTGSITIDKVLLDAADMCEGEKVQVVNINNGNRFETYIIEGKNGEICLNGAAARLAVCGDKVIIISYGMYSKEELKDYNPKIIFLDKENIAGATHELPTNK